MSIQIAHNWWEDLFDEIYLLTDARSVCNSEVTTQEVCFIKKILHMDKSASILDLCGGQGRHSLELSRSGFMDVTVLDYSHYLIEIGKRRAQQEKLTTKFIQGDARHTGCPGESYHFIITMASSFGYFINEGENEKILREAFRLLRPNGTMLLDLPDKEHVIRNFKPFSSHNATRDIVVNRERELGDDIIFTREIVTSKEKGCLRDRNYCIRLYSPEKIANLMRSSGFSSVSFQKDFMNRHAKEDYGCMNNRMVVKAIKN
ncbi:MAG: class I SAM-dependent methyltransferase [bacterium]